MPSSYKTPNFALNQWLGTDTFARTDFNADNLAIDAALAHLSDGLKVIDPLGKNLYNLILQNYYDGKYTGYKKALMFDGFLDYAGIASISEGLYRSNNNLTFDNVGYSSYKSISSPSGEENSDHLTRTWTPEYCTLASAISFLLRSSNTNATLTVTIKDDRGEVVGTATKVGGLPSSQTLFTVAFSSPVYFTAGRKYTIDVSCTSKVYLRVDRTNYWDIYFELVCSPTIRDSGTCVSLAADIGNDYIRAIGWARYSGGSVGLGLDIGGSTLDFTLIGTSSAHTVDGAVACTEAAFELDVPPGLSGDTAVRLMLDKNGDANMYVYDYGVLFI
jgi:hypothetical protein